MFSGRCGARSTPPDQTTEERQAWPETTRTSPLCHQRLPASRIDARTKTTLVEFALLGTRAFFGLVNAELPDRPTDFDLRSIYSEKRTRHPWPSLFRGGAIKILLHVRQGDTAALETPWNTVISQWPPEYRFTEYARFEDIPVRNRVLRVEDFHQFFKQFVSRIDEPVSTLLFSDGFSGSLRRLDRSPALLRCQEHAGRACSEQIQ